MDPTETAQRIARNEISEFDIDWRAYQRLVWWLISQETRIQAEPTYRSEIRHEEDAGIIDIVVRLTSPPVKLFGDDSFCEDIQIFIECKQYRATLTLDKVGKVFCHSILEQPDALWIVSPRRLSAQAKDYAKKIFRMNGPAARSPLLRRTRFRHWQLRELIDSRTRNPSVGFHVADWQIVQLTPFGTAVVASASTPALTRKRSVYSDGRGLFHVRLFVDGFSGATDRVELAFECSEPKDGLVALRNRALRGTDEIGAYISSIDISGCQVTGILIKDPHLGIEQRIEIGRIGFQSFDQMLFELRPLTAATIANQISPQSGDRIVCLSGLAGVGKSTLLEQVAWQLSREHGWDVRAHTISENTDYSFLYDLMEWFALAVAPLNFIEVNPDGNDVSRSIIATIAYRHSGLQTPEAVQNLVDAAARGAINEAQIQQIARILVRIAKARETPLLVVLRDMHSASPAVHKALLQLFLRLRDEGWGNVRFLIEARTDSDATGLAGVEHISIVAERLGYDFRPIDIRALTLEELHMGLRPHFRSPNFDETIRRLHHLTGGYPLLVDQLLRDLILRGVIVKIGTKPDRYAIDPNALKGLRLERAAPQLELFLRGRIERASLSTNAGIMAASLGIIAQTLRVTPEGVPKSLIIDLMAAALGATSEQVDECLDLATSLNFLRPEDAGRAVSFTHEATRSTAADFARHNTGFLRVVRRIANSNVLPQILGRFRSDLLQAYLALEIGQVGEAVRLALSAEASVADAGNLVQRRLALECAIDALSKNDRPDPPWARNELAVRERLVWTVMQQASQHFARVAIESSEQRISSMHATGLISSSERSTAAFHYARCRVVIGTRSLDAPVLLEALPTMCANALDPVQIHYALTRLILVAMEIDDTASACRAIEYCLRLPVLEQYPETRLSFLSEIGDMFAIDEPAIEAQVSQTAFELAESLLESGALDARSHAHAKINLFSARARVDPTSLDEKHLQSLSEQWSEQGFLNPLIRLMNLSGFVAVLKGQISDFDRAADWWTSCNELAETTGHQSIVWQVTQNLAILNRRRGIAHASTGVVSRIDEILDPFLSHAERMRGLVTRMLDDIAKSAPLSNSVANAILPVPLGAIRSVRHISSIFEYRERNDSGTPHYLV